MSVHVTDITVTPVSVPFETVLSGSTYEKARRETIVVEVDTDKDVTGRTYSMDFGDVGGDVRATVVRFIREEIAPQIEGRELFKIERTWEDLSANAERFPVWKSESRWCYLNALGAVDTALWDTIGRETGRPLYQLWGGYREDLPVIAIGGYYEEGSTMDDLVSEMEDYQRLGLAGVKCKVGKAPIDTDLERVRTIREAMGEEFVIACDSNQGWTVDEAIEFGRRASEYDIEWLEEPVVWTDQYRGMARVRRETNVPVCAGQSEITLSGCRQLIEAGSADIINLDASWAGGPTAWRKVAAMAGAFDVEMGHHEEPQVAMHLLASQPNGGYVEVFHPDRDPIWYEMLENTPQTNDGRLELPDGPGLGLEIDPAFVEEFKLEEA